MSDEERFSAHFDEKEEEDESRGPREERERERDGRDVVFVFVVERREVSDTPIIERQAPSPQSLTPAHPANHEVGGSGFAGAKTRTLSHKVARVAAAEAEVTPPPPSCYQHSRETNHAPSHSRSSSPGSIDPRHTPWKNTEHRE